MPDTLIIGLGGAGSYVCRRLVERIQASFGHTAQGHQATPDGQPLVPPTFLVLDTDRSSGITTGERSILLTTNTAMLDAAYRAPDRFHAEWMDREVLRGRTQVDSGTGGSRMLGRFLLLLPENQLAVRQRLQKWLEKPAEGKRRVYVVASAAGGTGGGMLIDTAFLVRHTAARLGVEVDVRGVVFVSPTSDPARSPASFATLTELHYFSDPCTQYSVHLVEAEGEPEMTLATRTAPFDRVSVLTALTTEGKATPLYELQERAIIFLMTATVGDTGEWSKLRTEGESRIPRVDPDGNPQVFSSFGTEWVEYPEERLVGAVYRNMVRRSLVPWLSGDDSIRLADLRGNVPLNDPDAMSRLLTESATGAGEASATEGILRPIRTRRPWIHKGQPYQWRAMDQEMETHLSEAIGTPPAPGRPGRGPVAQRANSLREQILVELRDQSRRWLSADNISLERIGRVLSEAAAELRTATDPSVEWESAEEICTSARRRTLWAVEAIRKDPFLLFWRGMALKRLALEYEKIAAGYVTQAFHSRSIPYLRELRGQIMEPIRAWAARVGELQALFATLSRSWADHESAMLERLRKDEEDKRLVLGLLNLPGSETPYIANSGWNLPYCRPEDESQAIRDLRKGWVYFLVDRDEGILANPGRSVLDGPVDEHRDARLPWLMPSSMNPTLESIGASTRMKEVISRVDWELRSRMEERLRAWLSATAFQRLAEQYRNPVDLEFQLQRLVAVAADLPALDPVHARPAGFPSEYELIFFGEAKKDDLPSAVRKVVESSSRDRPTLTLPSRSPHYLTCITEHSGFSLARCPAYHHLGDSYAETHKRDAPVPFSRVDIPWESAGLVTRARMRDASDVLFLALALGLARANPDGEIPVPPALAALEGRPRRFGLPGEFDRAVRQIAGDEELLESVARGVDRTVQAKGVEWSALQVERAILGESSLDVRFPGAPRNAPLDKQGPEADRAMRLAAVMATARHPDLLEEYGRTNAAQETEWLRVGQSHQCPACRHDLGADPAKLPGMCPACKVPLLPQKLAGAASADGFRRIPNPFVTGTPLETRSNVFVGREDIIRTVRERLIRPVSRTILILTGERRCGKTSALRQLVYRLEADLTPIFVDLQGLTATDLAGFVYWLAWRVKEGLAERGIEMELAAWEDFSREPPDFQFERVILPEIRRALKGGRVLLMLDEFEVLAGRVMNGVFDSRAFDYLRHLMQHVEGIEFLFAGTHILRKFAASYATFLFNIGVFLDVDFLQPEDARRLITEPVATAGVTFTPDAIEGILELAGAHAYFTQLFGFHLVERLNKLRKRNVTREDVEAEAAPVVGAASAHLDHLWGQLEPSEKLALSFFAEVCGRGQSRKEDDVMSEAIQADPTLRPFVFRSAVEKLMTIGMLRARYEDAGNGKQDRFLSLTAEVYRHWLVQSKPYGRLREEGLKWG